MPSRIAATMKDIFQTALETHATQLELAMRALACVPPQISLFYFHSRICDCVVQIITDLQEPKALVETVNLDPTASGSQTTEENPPAV